MTGKGTIALAQRVLHAEQGGQSQERAVSHGARPTGVWADGRAERVPTRGRQSSCPCLPTVTVTPLSPTAVAPTHTHPPSHSHSHIHTHAHVHPHTRARAHTRRTASATHSPPQLLLYDLPFFCLKVKSRKPIWAHLGVWLRGKRGQTDRWWVVDGTWEGWMDGRMSGP